MTYAPSVPLANVTKQLQCVAMRLQFPSGARSHRTRVRRPGMRPRYGDGRHAQDAGVIIRAPQPSGRHRASRAYAGARRSVGAESLSERLARGVLDSGNARAERLLSRARLTASPGARLPRASASDEALAVPRLPRESAEADGGGGRTVDSRSNAEYNAFAIELGRDMRIDPEISAMSIVAVGNFSPAVFHPAWFSLHGLLPAEAAEAAKEQLVVSPEATAFAFDWLTVEVKTEVFSMTTSQEPCVRVRDLAARLFGERLADAPVRALGINRTVHFRVRDMRARDRIGQTLAPKGAWGEWAKSLGTDGDHGGMTSLTMTQVGLDDRPDGDAINVKVEPSVLIGEKRAGVYVAVNDHYKIDQVSGESSERLLAILADRFEESCRWSEGIIDHVMSLAESRHD